MNVQPALAHDETYSAPETKALRVESTRIMGTSALRPHPEDLGHIRQLGDETQSISIAYFFVGSTGRHSSIVPGVVFGVNN
jgi:hypothetical protein